MFPFKAARGAGPEGVVAGAPRAPRQALAGALRACRRDASFGTFAEELGLSAYHCVRSRRAGATPDSLAIHRHMEALANNIPLRRILEQAGAALHAAGVRAIVYKGQDYLERIYGDLGARPMADIDLLVPEPELARAERALLEAGFLADRACRRQHERKFCKDGVAVDLHHRLLESGRMRIDHAAIFARALPCSYMPGLLVLEATDACLSHCINQTVKGFHLPAHSYLELQALLNDADEAELRRRARRWQALSALYASCAVLGQLGLARATRIARSLPISPRRRALLERTVTRFALQNVTRSQAPRATLLALKTTLIDDPVAAARFVPSWVRWALPAGAPRPLACESPRDGPARALN